MAKLSEGTGTVVLEGIDTPVVDTDAANKAYVDANSGGGGTDDITASGGLQRIDDDISIEDLGVTNAKLANGAASNDKIAANAVTESKISATNVPTSGQVLSSTSGGEDFTWVDQSGGNTPNYNDAPFGNIDTDGSILWSYSSNTPTTEGQVSISDEGDQGYELQFRTQDIDTINSVSVRYIQIGFGSPISFATYVVADLSITDTLVDVDVMDGPIDGDDILASLPANGTALSISVSVSQYRLPLSGLSDVSETTATDNQVLTWDNTNSEWAPADASTDDVITASEGLTRVGDDIQIADEGITTAKIDDLAITAAKIADGVIDHQKLDSTNTPAVGQVLSASSTPPGFTWVNNAASGNDIVTPEQIRASGNYSDVSTWSNNNAVGNGQYRPLTPNTGFDFRLDINKNDSEGNVVLDAASVALIVGSPVRITSGSNIGYYFFFENSDDTNSYIFDINFLTGVNVIADDLISSITIASSDQVLLANANEPGFGPALSENAEEYLNGEGAYSQPGLDGLSDVTVDTPLNSQFLRYNLAQTQWENTDVDIPNNIDDLSDVNTSGATEGQVLALNSSNIWAPVDNAGGGTQDYNNSALGSFDTDGTTLWTFSTTSNPATEGEVYIVANSSPDTGYQLQFRQADVDTANSVSVRLFQIGYGSPITFATYAVADLAIDNGFVTVDLVGGPLDGDDILSTLPADNTALSIAVSVSQYILPNLGNLPDVSDTAPTNDQILTWNSTDNLWEPQASQSGGATTLGGLNDVNVNNVADGFVLRYDADNSNYRVHSIGDTNRAYGGVDVDLSTGFTVPQGTGEHAVAIGNNAQATQDDALALGTDSDATGLSAIAVGNASTASDNNSLAVGNSSLASAESSSAFGDTSSAAHAEASAIGFGATTDQVNEVRLGVGDSHVTIEPNAAGTEGSDNQLASVRYVKDRISDASRIVNENINGIQTIVRMAQPTPWGDYRIDPYQSDDTTFQIAMSVIEFDASQPTYIFYPPMLQNIVNNMNGGGLTTGTIPSFFDEITNVQTPNNIGGIDGNDENALGWKYTGYQNATIWMATPVQILSQWRWVNHDASNESIFPPNVTVKFQLVHVKPNAGVYYIDDDSAVVIAETDNFTFYNPTRVAAGATVAHDVNLTFPTQTQSQGIVNVATDDMIALRYRISFKGNGFEWDNDTSTGLSLDAYIQNTSEFTPLFGIEHVTIGDSLVIESATGDLVYTDQVSSNTLLVVDNNSGDPIIPAATLGLVAGDNITITDKTIAAADSQALTAGDGISIDSDAIAIDFRTETNNPLEVSGTGDAEGLSLNIDEDGPLQKTTNGLDVILEALGGLGIGSLSSGIQIQRQTNSGIDINADGVSIDLGTGSGLQLGSAGLSIELDGSTGLNIGADGLSFLTSAGGGLTLNTLPAGIAIQLPANSGLQTTASGLSLNAGIDELTDVVLQTGDDAPTDGQVLTFDGTNWQNEDASGGNTLTAGNGIDITSDVVSAVAGTHITVDSSGINLNTATASGFGTDVNGALFIQSDPLIGSPLSVSADGLNWTGTLDTLDGVALQTGDDAPSDGQVLTFDGTNWQNEDATGGSSTLATLTDVTLGTLADGQVLEYDSDTSMWINATISGGGTFTAGSGLSFNTDSTVLNANSEIVDFSAVYTLSIYEEPSIVDAAFRYVVIGPNTTVGSSATCIGYAATASGSSSVALGTTASSSGFGAVALGASSSASASSSVSIGDESEASAIRAVALGDSSTASGTSSIALGYNSTASGADAISLGESSTSTGNNSIALGDTANASANESIAIGSASEASSTGAIAIGQGASSEDSRSIAIGDISTATDSMTTAVGYSADATGVSSTAIGDESLASGANSISVGSNSFSTGSSSVAVGNAAASTGAASVALGNAQATGARAVALGSGATSTADNSVCIGLDTTSLGSNSVVIGNSSSADNNLLSIAIGERATSGSIRGIAIGTSSNASSDSATLCSTGGDDSIAIGKACRASGDSGISIGDTANAVMNQCISIGNTATSGTLTNTSATAIGDNASATGQHSVAIGHDTNAAFGNSNAIGNAAVTTVANSTTLGSGTSHRVFAGSQELFPSAAVSAGATDITCSTNNEFFVNSFNPSSTSSESLKYVEQNGMASGTFDFALATTATTRFEESDRWSLNSTSPAMLAAFGFDAGTSATALGTFIISGTAYNSAAIGDVWVHPNSSATNVILSFRVRSAIGTAPTHSSIVSCQFTLPKF